MMRAILGALCLVLLLAGPAGAMVVEVWTESRIRIGAPGRGEAVSTATGVATIHTSSTASAHLSTITLPPLSLSSTIPLTDPGSAPLTNLLVSIQGRSDLPQVVGNLSGAIGGGGALTPRTLPVTGGLLYCLPAGISSCVGQLFLPFGATSAAPLAGFGVGGLLTVGGTGTIRISNIGAPYTVDTVSVPVRTGNGGFDLLTARGFAHGPASLTSSTAETSGVLQIVTATHTLTVGPGDADIGGSISRTLVHIIPEPGLLLLFGSGAGFVAWLGHRRNRPED